MLYAEDATVLPRAIMQVMRRQIGSVWFREKDDEQELVLMEMERKKPHVHFSRLSMRREVAERPRPAGRDDDDDDGAAEANEPAAARPGDRSDAPQ